jgi:hypothetical protein
VNQDGTQTVIVFRLPTGESLCLRCGRTTEAFIESERKDVIKRAVSELSFRHDFEGAADILERGGQNPFRHRVVRGESECGLELIYPAALVPVEVWEKEMEFSVSEVKSVKVASFPASLYGGPIDGILLDPKDTSMSNSVALVRFAPACGMLSRMRLRLSDEFQVMRNGTIHCLQGQATLA